ncbi:MAG: helix-turn-helix transcriptional regulator [Alphaproteobacteria bacterium]|nr:helix-turn-helix transcriptional regulator [Alphaproteobacteria bacterium]
MTKSVFTDRYRLFLQLLIQERKNKGITQVKLAALLQKPQSYVSKYENGERRLDVIEFLETADCIGIDAADFIKKLKGN